MYAANAETDSFTVGPERRMAAAKHATHRPAVKSTEPAKELAGDTLALYQLKMSRRLGGLKSSVE